MARNGKNKTGSRKQGLDARGGNRKDRLEAKAKTKSDKRSSPGMKAHRTRRIVEDAYRDNFCRNNEDKLMGLAMEIPTILTNAYGELLFYLDEMVDGKLFEDRLRAMLSGLEKSGKIESFILLKCYPRWDKKEKIDMLRMRCK